MGKPSSNYIKKVKNNLSLLIYTETLGPRLEYILKFIFDEVLACEYELTTDLENVKKHKGACINYSNKKIENTVRIVPHALLSESVLTKQEIECFLWHERKAFFKTSNEEVSFDIFSATFYLVSRYEEYVIKDKDEFHRFPHEKSFAFKEGFLTIPLVDIWLIELKNILLAHSPKLVCKQKEFKFIPTYDIDIAYSYKHKGLLRNAGGAIRDISKGDFASLKNRKNVLLNKAEDPFDSFKILDQLHEQFNLSPIYFFLLGSGGKLDKNLPVGNKQFQLLIQDISTKYPIGIHPSFRSNDKVDELPLEINRLQKISSKEINKSRQHYIRFTLPETFQNLIEQGIKEEYSMGYGSINGFRASTANPFFWFDLENNKVTDLKVFPFCFMECNSFFEQKQNIEETKKEIAHYIGEVKNVKGSFISIWHNFSLGSEPLWKGWLELYKYQLELINPK